MAVRYRCRRARLQPQRVHHELTVLSRPVASAMAPCSVSSTVESERKISSFGSHGGDCGALACLGCGVIGADLMPHLLAAAADAYVDLRGAGGGAAEIIRRAPHFGGTLAKLLEEPPTTADPARSARAPSRA